MATDSAGHPPADLDRLAGALRERVDRALTLAHSTIDHEAPWPFLMGHRQMLACVEAQLARLGIVLPLWPAVEALPAPLAAVVRSPVPCAASPLCEQGFNDTALVADRVRQPLPADLGPDAICAHADAAALHAPLKAWHDRVHTDLGGVATTGDAPAWLGFFPWHKQVDAIFASWEACPRVGAPAPGPAPAHLGPPRSRRTQPRPASLHPSRRSSTPHPGESDWGGRHPPPAAPPRAHLLRGRQSHSMLPRLGIQAASRATLGTLRPGSCIRSAAQSAGTARSGSHAKLPLASSPASKNPPWPL